MPTSGRLIKTANSDKVVLVSGMKEILFAEIEVYREALKDIKRFIEFEVELEMIESGYYFYYQIIVPDNLFQNYEEEKRTSDTGGESSEEKG